MNFAITICVLAVATQVYSLPLTFAAKQSNRPSPPVASSGSQRPQPPVNKQIQKDTSTQEFLGQPQKEVSEIVFNRPNFGEVVIIKPQEHPQNAVENVRPKPEVVEIIHQKTNVDDIAIEVVKPQQGVEYFNGKVIYEPHYPKRV